MNGLYRILIFALFWAVSCGGSAFASIEQGEADRLFTQAVGAYKEGRFVEAITFDEKILAGGLESAEVYYNLGNAYLRNKEMGKAIVNYLRAERLSPRDADIRANITFSRNNVEGYQSWGSPQGVGKLLSFSRTSEAELKWISLVILMAGGTFFVWGLYAGLRLRRLVVWAVAAVLAWGYVVGVMATRRAEQSARGVILKSVEVKYEPSKEATTYFKLSPGSEVAVLRGEDGWVKLTRPDHKSGWVPAESVEKVFP